MHTLARPAAADRRRDELHPAIDAGLFVFPKPIASMAERLIRTLLASRANSASPDRWRGSRLTGDGFPFELSFSTADERLRFTVEPGTPDLEPAKRLDVAVELLQQLNAGPVSSDVLKIFRAVQSSGALKYGAWIGCRVAPEHVAFKLYVEVPEECGMAKAFQPGLELPDRVVSTRMIGYSPATATLECYVRVPSLEPRHLPAVLAPAGHHSRAAELVQFIEAAYGYSIRGRVPGPSVGVSYIAEETGRRATVYLFARSLWGSDARIRREFSRWASSRAWNPAAYLAATEPMAARESSQTFHGLLGISLGSSEMPLAIGVRPVTS